MIRELNKPRIELWVSGLVDLVDDSATEHLHVHQVLLVSHFQLLNHQFLARPQTPRLREILLVLCGKYP